MCAYVVIQGFCRAQLCIKLYIMHETLYATCIGIWTSYTDIYQYRPLLFRFWLIHVCITNTDTYINVIKRSRHLSTYLHPTTKIECLDSYMFLLFIIESSCNSNEKWNVMHSINLSLLYFLNCISFHIFLLFIKLFQTFVVLDTKICQG